MTDKIVVRMKKKRANDEKLHGSFIIRLDANRVVEIPMTYEILRDGRIAWEYPDEFRKLAMKALDFEITAVREPDGISFNLDLYEIYPDFDKIKEKLWQKYRNVKVIR